MKRRAHFRGGYDAPKAKVADHARDIPAYCIAADGAVLGAACAYRRRQRCHFFILYDVASALKHFRRPLSRLSLLT